MQTLASSPSVHNGHTAPAVIPQGPAFTPEALCSVTVRVAIPGCIGDTLITGRGATPDEMAHNLTGSIEATRQAFQPPSREEQLSKLLACGVLKATQRGDFALVDKLTKAFMIAVKGLVEPAERAGVYAVRSQNDLNLWYSIEGTACSCPDWQKHAHAGDVQHKCKHILASLMYQRVEEA